MKKAFTAWSCNRQQQRSEKHSFGAKIIGCGSTEGTSSKSIFKEGVPVQHLRGVAPPGAQCWWLDRSKVTKSCGHGRGGWAEFEKTTEGGNKIGEKT